MLLSSQSLSIECKNKDELRKALKFYRKFCQIRDNLVLDWRIEEGVLVLSSHFVKENKPSVNNKLDNLVDLCVKLLSPDNLSVKAKINKIEKSMEYAEDYEIGYRVFSPSGYGKNKVGNYYLIDILAVELVGIEWGK